MFHIIHLDTHHTVCPYCSRSPYSPNEQFRHFYQNPQLASFCTLLLKQNTTHPFAEDQYCCSHMQIWSLMYFGEKVQSDGT